MNYESMNAAVNQTYTHRGKENMNFRKKEKEILDEVLGSSRYDSRIRPAGHQNDTSEWIFIWYMYSKNILFDWLLVVDNEDGVSYGGGNHQYVKGLVHFRKKKKAILDQILGSNKYDCEIRPPGHVNDTSGWTWIKCFTGTSSFTFTAFVFLSQDIS